MQKRYTSNNLIQIIYGEASLEEYFQLDDAMEADPAIRVEFRNLYDVINMMPNVSIAPSKELIGRVLSISKENL